MHYICYAKHLSGSLAAILGDVMSRLMQTIGDKGDLCKMPNPGHAPIVLYHCISPLYLGMGSCDVLCSSRIAELC